MRVRDATRAHAVLGRPLMGASRALGQLPFVAEQVPEEVVAPLGRRRGPGDFEPAANGVATLAGAEGVGPAKTLQFDAGGFRLGPDQRRVTRAMGLAKGVAAGDQRHGLFVVHRHAGKGVADVAGRSQRIGVATRTFRIDVDEAHLHSRQRVLELALTGIALLVGEPLALLAPVDVELGLPGVGAAAGKAEGLEAHRLKRNVAGEDEQVGPGNPVAVFLLDRPKQAPGLVQVYVVRPGVERREALLALAAAAATIGNAIGAGAVPGHADEQRAIVPEIGWPPVLRVGHQRREVGLESGEVELLELFGIVKARAHRVRKRRVLVEHRQVELVRPPVAVLARHVAMRDRALARATIRCCVHFSSPFVVCALSECSACARPGSASLTRINPMSARTGTPPADTPSHVGCHHIGRIHHIRPIDCTTPHDKMKLSCH